MSRVKSKSFLGATVWEGVIIVDARLRDMNRLVLFRLVGKWVQVFEEEGGKAKNLLKIKKAVVSCAREDQTGSKAQNQIALNWQRNRHTSGLDTGFKSDVLNQSNRYQNIFLDAL